MKKLFLLSFLFISTAQATEFCPIQSKGDAIAQLAKELEAACDWSIQKLAQEKIIKDCENAQKNDSSIRFKTSYGETSLQFSQFGDTYNHNEANIACKHNRAYRIRLNQVINQLNQEAYTAQRNQSSNSGRRSQTSSPPTPQPQEKLWKCRVPNYIKTFRIANEAEKFAIENAHGDVCVVYRQ